MCGICGFTGNSLENTIVEMTNQLVHRGPDEDGFYQAENISMGMRRLSIVDLTTGQQPVSNEDQSIWVVFNGEIYNHEELRYELQSLGHRFYTDHSDTEVLVHLYEQYGLEFPLKLNGMFAIAIWDERQKRLILVRDRMGVKPLFYYQYGENIIFGSEIKAIAVHPDYKKAVNHEAIYHYFSFKNVPAPLTAFKGVYSLLPGEILIHDDKGTYKNQYWQIEYIEQPDLRLEEIKYHIRDLLEDAVKIRMNMDVPYGAFLSGGLDSSTVVALMSRFSEQPIKTFALGYSDNFDHKQADIDFARRVAKQFKTEHHEYMMSFDELPLKLTRVIQSFDQPFSGTISTYFLAGLISQNVKVALSGDGADELFGSYLAHRLAQPMDYYHRYRLQEVDNNCLSNDQRLSLRPFDNDLDYLKTLYVKSNGNQVDWRCQLLTFSDLEKTRLLSNDFLKTIPEVRTYPLMERYFQRVKTADPLNKILGVDWTSLLPDQVLAFVDFLSMAHSLEVRSPFLDYRLVEYVATLPGSLKINHGVVKYILKQAAKDILPAGITERAKEGFVLPVYQWLQGPLKSYAHEMLSQNQLRKQGVFNPVEVDNLLTQFDNGTGGTNILAKVWNLLMFQVWWDCYFG